MTQQTSVAFRALARSRGVLVVSILCGALWAGCAEPPAPVRTQPVVPVRSEVVEEADFQAALSALGVVRSFQTISVNAIDGGIVRYPDRFTQGLRSGADVAQGELLTRFDNEQVRFAAAEARLQAEAARVEFERKKSGLEAGTVPEAELFGVESEHLLAKERLRNAENRVERLTVVALRSGKLIVEESIPPGSEVAPGTRLAEVSVAGPPRVEGWVAASDRSLLRTGLAVRFTAPGVEHRTWRGTLREISPVTDAAGTVRIVADAEDAVAFPSPGEGVEIAIELDLRRHVLAVPESSVVLSSGVSSVFLLEPRGRQFSVRRVEVETGKRGAGRVEILSGLRPGDRIAVAGVSMLVEGGLATEVPLPDETPREQPRTGDGGTGASGDPTVDGSREYDS